MAASPASVYVVTDSDEIADVVHGFGGQVIISQGDHASGTDRLSEAVEILGLGDDQVVVNLQGDEPLMPSACLAQVADLLLADPSADMATLCSSQINAEQWRDPDVVKVVTRDDGEALCFSRAPIPYARSKAWPEGLVRRHVGLYAYRVSALKAWRLLSESDIERSESLEQWRALSAGWRIVCADCHTEIPPGVDNAEDLERVRAYFNA